MRKSTIFLVFFALIIGGGLFHLKYEVMRLESEYHHTQNAILKTKEALSILNAEWSHLTSPERLKILCHRHLPLVPISSRGESLLREGEGISKLHGFSSPSLTGNHSASKDLKEKSQGKIHHDSLPIASSHPSQTQGLKASRDRSLQTPHQDLDHLIADLEDKP